MARPSVRCISAALRRFCWRKLRLPAFPRGGGGRAKRAQSKGGTLKGPALALVLPGAEGPGKTPPPPRGKAGSSSQASKQKSGRPATFLFALSQGKQKQMHQKHCRKGNNGNHPCPGKASGNIPLQDIGDQQQDHHRQHQPHGTKGFRTA